MHETENAILYATVPRQDGDDVGESVGLLLDEAALRALLDGDPDDGSDEEAPRRVTAVVVCDRGGGSMPARFGVLEVAGRWFGPVDVVAPVPVDGRVPVLEDGGVVLRVGPAMHVPGRLLGSVDVQ